MSIFGNWMSPTPLNSTIRLLIKSPTTEPMLKSNVPLNKSPMPLEALVVLMLSLISLSRNIVLTLMLGIGQMTRLSSSNNPLCLKDLELVTVGIMVEMLPSLLTTNTSLDVMTWVRSLLTQKCQYLSNLLLEIWIKVWLTPVLLLVL